MTSARGAPAANQNPVLSKAQTNNAPALTAIGDWPPAWRFNNTAAPDCNATAISKALIPNMPSGVKRSFWLNSVINPASPNPIAKYSNRRKRVSNIQREKIAVASGIKPNTTANNPDARYCAAQKVHSIESEVAVPAMPYAVSAARCSGKAWRRHAKKASPNAAASTKRPSNANVKGKLLTPHLILSAVVDQIRISAKYAGETREIIFS